LRITPSIFGNLSSTKDTTPKKKHTEWVFGWKTLPTFKPTMPDLKLENKLLIWK